MIKEWGEKENKKHSLNLRCRTVGRGCAEQRRSGSMAALGDVQTALLSLRTCVYTGGWSHD